MLKRYLEHGIDNFEDHEILEIFLYTAYSRRNTNDISHQLINRFGSLEGVLNAGFDELMQEKDVGLTAAALISFMKDFARRFNKDLAGIKLSDSNSMRDYCRELLKATSFEETHAVFLDRSMNLVGELRVSEGGSDSTEFDLRAIVTKAISTQCSNIVLAHGHPRGILLPSSADIAATRRICRSLNDIGINLLDHLIFSEEGSYSMRAAGMMPDLWS